MVKGSTGGAYQAFTWQRDAGFAVPPGSSHYAGIWASGRQHPDSKMNHPTAKYSSHVRHPNLAEPKKIRSERQTRRFHLPSYTRRQQTIPKIEAHDQESRDVQPGMTTIVWCLDARGANETENPLKFKPQAWFAWLAANELMGRQAPQDTTNTRFYPHQTSSSVLL